MAGCEVDSQPNSQPGAAVERLLPGGSLQNSQRGLLGSACCQGQPAEQSAGSSGGALAAMGHAGSPGAG